MTTHGFQSQTLLVSGITEVETLANILNFSPKVDESRLQSLINQSQLKTFDNTHQIKQTNKQSNNCLK